MCIVFSLHACCESYFCLCGSFSDEYMASRGPDHANRKGPDSGLRTGPSKIARGPDHSIRLGPDGNIRYGTERGFYQGPIHCVRVGIPTSV